VDAIIHTAGPHGIHLEQVPPAGFTDVNVSGTLQLLEAAVEHDVRRFVFSSTVGVLGGRLERWSPTGPWLVDESVAPLPGNIYVLSKVLAEVTCDYYARTAGREVVVLRYGRLREEGEHLGMEWALSGQLTDVRDAAAANVTAVAAPVAASPLLVNLVPPTVVGPADAQRLTTAPAAAIVGERLGVAAEEAERIRLPAWAWLTTGPAHPAFARFEHSQADFVRDALVSRAT
jgi:nucleoside-diphosphate-sugar epimerase